MEGNGGGRREVGSIGKFGSYEVHPWRKKEEGAEKSRTLSDKKEQGDCGNNLVIPNIRYMIQTHPPSESWHANKGNRTERVQQPEEEKRGSLV